MERITRSSLAWKVAERWKAQYCERDYGSGVETWRGIPVGDSGGIYDRLRSLGNTPDPDAVDTIVGNQSWTHLRCGRLDCPHGSVYHDGPWIMFSDGDECAVIICVDCVKEAAELLR